ncbi:hypothetical protein H0249_08805 [Pectobacterium brasiliense]|uniref:hypothetical protein n=1 Tax=Pectobacterium brasiliense TaxID=180957 RepID=UPI0015DDEC9D|nr:hypothetical protein [Pectobacterium brasiliense]MBA0196614.1 hypothetical protein [Pectobacterium brasiliense]MBN3092966.1 hypothetical protein [Pectobacterium brasiliense]
MNTADEAHSKKPLCMTAKQAVGMKGMADLFIDSDTHLYLIKYSERQSAEVTEQRGFLARLRKHNPVG